MTYIEAYKEGMLSLKRAGVEEFDLDAKILLEFVCQTKRSDFFAHGDRELTEDELTTFRTYIERRSKREPLQHITGEQEFMGLRFKVNKHVLVPRQDTETLVEEALKHIHDGMRVLDMATGSGCILISLLHYTNHCEGIGADIDEDSLLVAKENAELLKSNAVFVQSDLFENIKGIFDVIVSNPPYIRTDVLNSLMPEVIQYEPEKALDGKADGLFFYRKIASLAKGHMRKESYLLFEIGYDQAEQVSDLLKEEGYVEIQVIKDYQGNDRVVKAMHPW